MSNAEWNVDQVADGMWLCKDSRNVYVLAQLRLTGMGLDKDEAAALLQALYTAAQNEREAEMEA